MKKIIFLFISLLVWIGRTNAQELNAKVSVRAERLQGVDPKIFETLQASLIQMLNTNKWTEDAYKPFEKIEVSFLLNLTARTNNIYKGTLTVQASRPVFNTSYQSPIVNFMDKDVAFKYEQGQVVIFDQQRITGSDPLASNLTALFGYYVNLILGLHYDSFSQGGGTEYFKKAQNIVINAPDEGEIAGWKSNDGNNKNRFWLIDQFLNPRYANFRPYFYVYHRFGMDMMTEKPEEAVNSIMDGLTNIETINKENPGSILLQFFFNAKSAEYINLLKSVPEAKRKQLAAKLAVMDIPNASRYNDAR
ncbi:MAG: DUF4835 family protein [Taibaiella sp.]|nr:DUF4835 family protein [Taibaiella sp.]